MMRLPARPSLGHLRTQAKDLLALYRSGAPEAMARFRESLPAAAGRDDDAIARLDLRLHDAQSCIARTYGFAAWADLKSFVEARNAEAADPEAALLRLLRLVYAGDIAGGRHRARPAAAARMIAESPDLPRNDPYLACALGDEAVLRAETRRDPAWVNRPGGPLALPPLVAATHSSLVRMPAFRDRVRAAARFLLDQGAAPDQSVASRWERTPGAPDEKFPLSALYGAAGQNHDAVLTQLLLERGADPNDNESLYHSLESPACTRLLLAAGARVTGTNALYRALDLEDVTPLELLLAHGGDPNEAMPGAPASHGVSPLVWAIRRRRSPAHVAALLAAGADPSAETPTGETAHVLALKFGLPDVARLLRKAGGEARELSAKDAVIAACARGDEDAARSILSERPDLVATLPESDMRLLPALAAEGAERAVRVMVRLGWPIATPGGDWNASALNHAVFRGDAHLARFLLQHGASWTERHGFGDNVCGTLAWASCNEPVAGGDWPGCAEALRAYGLPRAERDPHGSQAVVVAGGCRLFSADVTEILLEAEPPQAARVAPGGLGG